MLLVPRSLPAPPLTCLGMIMIFQGRFLTKVGGDKTDSLRVEKLLTVKLKVA